MSYGSDDELEMLAALVGLFIVIAVLAGSILACGSLLRWAVHQ